MAAGGNRSESNDYSYDACLWSLYSTLGEQMKRAFVKFAQRPASEWTPAMCEGNFYIYHCHCCEEEFKEIPGRAAVCRFCRAQACCSAWKPYAFDPEMIDRLSWL